MPRHFGVGIPLSLIVLLLLMILNVSQAGEVTGKVVGVHDGDSLTLLTEEEVQIKIRLEGIDAPELKQAFGNVAKKTLSDLCFGKTVRVAFEKADRYGRTLGNVYEGENWLNLALVEKGMAWVYLKYSHDPQLLKAEAQARKEKAGLWLDPSPLPLWQWRAEKKTVTARVQ